MGKRSVSPIVVSRTPETAKKSSSKLVAKSTPKPPKVVAPERKTEVVKENNSRSSAKRNAAAEPPGFDREEYKRLKEKYKKKPPPEEEEEDEEEEEEEEEKEEKPIVKKNGILGSKRSLTPQKSTELPSKKPKENKPNNHVGIISSKNNDVEKAEPPREVVNLKKIQDKLAESLRLCLHYFSPPSWPTKKEDLINLDLDKLLDFPLNKFFDTYEVNLTELIAQYQQHASDAEKRAETTETKLANLRKLVMQLLKPSLNFDTETDCNTDEIGDNVDEILAAVVKESTKSSQPSDVTS